MPTLMQEAEFQSKQTLKSITPGLGAKSTSVFQLSKGEQQNTAVLRSYSSVFFFWCCNFGLIEAVCQVFFEKYGCWAP